MIELHKLRPPEGSNRDRKRIGRGPGSGTGKTSGRGEKGQNARSGGGVPAWFEGGQMPLQRRIPKRGFKPRNRKEYQIVNVSDLHYVEGDVSPESLRRAGLVRSASKLVKILGNGDVDGAFHCSVHAISSSAQGKIEAAGGSVTLLTRATEPAGGEEE